MNVYFLRLGRIFPGIRGGDEMIIAGDNPRDAYRQARGVVEGLSAEAGQPTTLESGDITSMNPIEPEDVAFFNNRWFSRMAW